MANGQEIARRSEAPELCRLSLVEQGTFGWFQQHLRSRREGTIPALHATAPTSDAKTIMVHGVVYLWG